MRVEGVRRVRDVRNDIVGSFFRVFCFGEERIVAVANLSLEKMK